MLQKGGSDPCSSRVFEEKNVAVSSQLPKIPAASAGAAADQSAVMGDRNAVDARIGTRPPEGKSGFEWGEPVMSTATKGPDMFWINRDGATRNLQIKAALI